MSELSATAGPRAVWQVSAGPASRSYADVFLKYGVALIGPGDPGLWVPERDDDEFQGSYVRRFASEIADDDAVLLRTGIATISALGLVSGGYRHLNAFDDVNGWDLQHARRVRWSLLAVPQAFAASVFGANPPRCSRVWNQEVVDFAERFIRSPPTHWQTAPLPELRADEPPLEAVPGALSHLVAQAKDLQHLYWNGNAFGDRPSEDEMIVHFVVPFLRSLGWSVEQIAVKWHYIDVAVFRALPRKPENCRFVIEAKRFGDGIEGAREQAETYVKTLGVPCDVIVTDGIRFRRYASDSDFVAQGYANLICLKRSAATLFELLRRP